ncbi:MAG: hypothetical protein EON95_02240 [Caulobacteraceae bacterium]|nr:MAG: hypothetical protein EON95_02240 [Caulobacteraceae bacterium]
MARPAFMALAIAMTLATPACDAAPPAKDQPQAILDREPTPLSCAERWRSAEDARRPVETPGFKRLTARLAAGGRGEPPDPEADARQAAARGEFGLYWTLFHGGRSAAGVTCAGPHENTLGASGLVRSLTYGASDAMTAAPSKPPPPLRTRDYFGRYNRAIVAHPAFPYPDICRPGRGPDIFKSITRPEEWLAPPLPVTRSPRTLAEAARHGTAAALEQWIARDPAAIARADDFGLTPLAWAVLGDRAGAVDLLLAAGADPVPASCARLEGSPLVLALRLRRPYADRLLAKADLERPRAWPQTTIDGAIRQGSAGP